MGHTQIVGQNGLLQSRAGGHPIPRFSALQPTDDEFRHSQPVQTPEDTGGGPLQATSKEPKIKDWVVNEFLAIPTAHVFAEGFNKHSRAIDDRSYRHVRPKRINHPTQCSDFLKRIAAVAIQGGHTHSPEGVHIPGPQKHPHLVTFLLELHTAAPVGSGPVQTSRKNPWVHPIQDNRLKQQKNWIHTGHVEHTEQTITTNQDLVP